MKNKRTAKAFLWYHIYGSLHMFKTCSIEFKEFFTLYIKWLFVGFKRNILWLESLKSDLAGFLYRKRGKYTKHLIHTGMASLSAVGMMIAPIVADEFPGRVENPWDVSTNSMVLSASTEVGMATTISDKEFRDKTIDYTVVEGDTLSTIADKFGVSQDTVRWENSLDKKGTIKPGQSLKILPVTGVSHRVKKGDTIYSLAEKYDSDAQAVVNFPFNTFVNDETFELAIGQTVIIPEGVKQEPAAPSIPRTRQLTPDAGTVVASGSYVWPTNGTISQGFSWYHKAVDIANRAAPSVLAADNGKVVIAGWVDNSGYGNRVVIDHGNGSRTLYAHLQKIYVVPGQSVSRGASLGQMGSTGRSTGTHLHFEIITGSGYINPLSVLK